MFEISVKMFRAQAIRESEMITKQLTSHQQDAGQKEQKLKRGKGPQHQEHDMLETG